MKVLLDVNLPIALHTPLTAVSRNRTVLIRNLRHFRPLQIPAHNLFDSLPAPHGL